jgi:RNA polymerase sigma-70 factor, ECF subfamily
LLLVDQEQDRVTLSGDEGKAASDADLIRRARMNDEAAFRRIVERYQDQVAATVVGMLGRGPESDDMGQETFIRLYRSLNDIRGGSSLGTYLTRIAINLCLDAIRRNQRRRFWFRMDEPPNEALPTELVVDESRHIENSERREWISKAVRSLDPKHRAVVVLRMMAGYSTKETAELLKIPIGTVLSRLSRAQDRLRLKLQPLMED